MGRERRKWTIEEDSLLREAVNKGYGAPERYASSFPFALLFAYDETYS